MTPILFLFPSFLFPPFLLPLTPQNPPSTPTPTLHTRWARRWWPRAFLSSASPHASPSSPRRPARMAMAARTARTVACSRSRAPPRAQGRRRRRRRRRASFGRWRWARRCFGCSGRSVRANGCALTRRWLARAAAGQEVPGASSQRSSAPRSVRSSLLVRAWWLVSNGSFSLIGSI